MVRYLAAQWHDGRLVSAPILISEHAARSLQLAGWEILADPADEARDEHAHADIEAVRQSDEARYRPRAGWHS